MGGVVIHTLYIIGNGFDVAHGLHTNYWQFREYLEDEDPVFLREFEGLYDKAVNRDLWSEFEMSMGKPNTKEMIGQSESATEGMPSVDIRDHMDAYWEEQFGFITKLHNYVKDWIESVDTSSVPCKKKSLMDSDDVFFTFNYTDILERVYHIQKVLHIHGGVGRICNIAPIIGHCNKKGIQQHRKWAKEADEDDFEAEASVLDAVADYLEAIYKDTRERILLNQSFFDGIDKVNHIVILGWSAGDTDMPYLKEIIQKVDKNARWTVYWYDEKAYKALTSAFYKEGITDKRVIEYIQAKEFWDE